jgi:hypothetical protein
MVEIREVETHFTLPGCGDPTSLPRKARLLSALGNMTPPTPPPAQISSTVSPALGPAASIPHQAAM